MVGDPAAEQVGEFGAAFVQAVFGAVVEYQFAGFAGPMVNCYGAGEWQAGVGLAVDDEQGFGREQASALGAVGLGGEGNYAGDVVADGAGGDDYGAAEGMAHHNGGAVSGGAQEVDAGDQVQGAFVDVVGLAVVEAQGGDALGGEVLGQFGVEAAGRAGKAAAGAAYPSYGAGGAGRGVADGGDVAPVGAYQQAIASLARRGRANQNLLNLHSGAGVGRRCAGIELRGHNAAAGWKVAFLNIASDGLGCKGGNRAGWRFQFRWSEPAEFAFRGGGRPAVRRN